MTEVLILHARMRPVGNLQVRRLLPTAKKQAVGPFLFFDHFGPEEFEPFKDADIGPPAIAPALANAVAVLTGKRYRSLPFEA